MASLNTSGSVEATGKLSQEDISKLYVAIFNRASEGEGNEYWQNEANLATAADKMLATADAKEYFGDALNNDKSFIEWIYKNTFDKTEKDDAKGIDYWTHKLESGESRGQVVADIVTAATSPENSGKAQLQFEHRVKVSDKMADTVFNVVNNYKQVTGFDGDLKVTADDNTFKEAINKINSMAGDVEDSLSWAVKEGIISDTLKDFLEKEMPELKTDFSDGIKESMEKLSHSSMHLKKDIDDALEKLAAMKGEYSHSMKNVLSFLHHVKIDTSAKAALSESNAEIKASLDTAVAKGLLSKDVAEFVKEELPKIKAGVDISGNLNDKMKADIKAALASDDLNADVHGLLSLCDDSNHDFDHNNKKDSDSKDDSHHNSDTDHDSDSKDDSHHNSDTDHDSDSKDDSHHMIKENVNASEIYAHYTNDNDAHIELVGLDSATSFDSALMHDIF